MSVLCTVEGADSQTEDCILTTYSKVSCRQYLYGRYILSEINSLLEIHKAVLW